MIEGFVKGAGTVAVAFMIAAAIVGGRMQHGQPQMAAQQGIDGVTAWFDTADVEIVPAPMPPFPKQESEDEGKKIVVWDERDRRRELPIDPDGDVWGRGKAKLVIELVYDTTYVEFVGDEDAVVVIRWRRFE